MMYWIGMTAAGLCATFSFYLAWLIWKAEDTQPPWLFLAFGCFFAIPLFIAAIKAAARRFSMFKQVERALDLSLSGSEKARPTFVPHWQMMAMIIIAIVCILAAVLVPLFTR